MTEENNVSSLQQHLEGGTATAIETALNLKATVGFPYSDYKYDVFDWDSESDYNKFIEYGSTASSISGKYYDSREEERYETTIILYNGKYYAQVEKEWEYGGGTVYQYDSFPDYLSALKFAYGVVFN
jgi:hypothetical protein